jgi:hypothetical protein
VSGTLIDWVVAFGRAVASSVSGETQAVRVQVAGIAGIDPTSESAETGEVAEDSEAFGALGIVSRPRPPEVKNNRNVHAELVCLRTSDGLLPIAWRDVRLDQAFPGGQKEGSTALAGYGGGFVTLDLTATDSGSRKANILVAYCPFQFDVNGVATKAHSIILNPAANGGITITHADGYQLSITTDSGIMFNTPSANVWGQVKGDLIFLQAPKIMLKGNVGVGAQPEAGIPLLAGPASPPCPSLFVSPV